MDNSLAFSIFMEYFKTKNAMKKSGSNAPKETLEQELKRLRKENAKLKSQKEAEKAKVRDLRKELQRESKKKVVPTITMTEEQRKLLSSLFPDIDSLFS